MLLSLAKFGVSRSNRILLVAAALAVYLLFCAVLTAEGALQVTGTALALILGVVLGLVFEYGGYPAAAAAHIAINALALLRLQRAVEE